MFSSDKNRYLPVILNLADGSVVEGEINCGLTANLDNALNREGIFVEIRDASGHSSFVAKTQISVAKLADNGAKTGKGNEKARDFGGINDADDTWHEVLQVSPKADRAEVRRAYHALAKIYHPDLYGDGLPHEVRKYAQDMFARINQAYEEFEATYKAAA